MYNDSRKNQGNSHTLLRLKQRTLQKILVGLDIFRKLLYNDDSRKNQGGIIGKTMTQNTTKNDKREQCDTKHNALKIYLTRKNLLRRTLFLQPTRQRVYSILAFT